MTDAAQPTPLRSARELRDTADVLLFNAQMMLSDSQAAAFGKSQLELARELMLLAEVTERIESVEKYAANDERDAEFAELKLESARSRQALTDILFVRGTRPGDVIEQMRYLAQIALGVVK